MIHVQAPAYYRPAPGDPPAVFLAGGITGVVDWQSRVVAALGTLRCVILNPRRASDTTDAAGQIAWEYHHLHLPGVLTMFWFPACDPKVTVQPIALFELGAASADPARRIVVGADNAYPRRLDIVLQLAHAKPELTVRSTLETTIAAVRSWLGQASPVVRPTGQETPVPPRPQ